MPPRRQSRRLPRILAFLVLILAQRSLALRGGSCSYFNKGSGAPGKHSSIARRSSSSSITFLTTTAAVWQGSLLKRRSKCSGCVHAHRPGDFDNDDRKFVDDDDDVRQNIRMKQELMEYLLSVPFRDNENKEENQEIETRVRKWLNEIIIGLNLCPFAERAVRGVVVDSSNIDHNIVDTFLLHPTTQVSNEILETSTTPVGVTSIRPLLKIVVVRGHDDELILRRLGMELLWRQSRSGTTLVVCPECHVNDFEAFMDLVQRVEDELIHDGLELEGELQIAPFHPFFRFQGSSLDDEEQVDDWTNRSPFPIFHILREDEVEQAVDRLDGDAGRVWKRNVHLLHAIYQELGKSGLERLYSLSSSPLTVSGGLTPPTETTTTIGINEIERATVKSLLRKHRVNLSPPTKGVLIEDEEENQGEDINL